MSHGTDCIICNRTATPYVSVCQNCREFFIRSCHQAKKWTCQHNDGACEFFCGSPRYCRACRFEKCIRANIQLPFSEILKKKACVPYFKNIDLQMKAEEVSLSRYPKGLKLLKRVNRSSSSVEFANHMLHFETKCSNLNAISPSEVDVNLDVSLGDVLYNPQCCSSRELAGWDQWRLIPSNTKYQMRSSYGRLVTLFADFISSVPEIMKLHISDKLKLSQQSFMPFVTFSKCYHAWKEKIPLEGSLSRAERYSAADGSYKNTISAMNNGLKINVHQSFEELSVNDQEIVLLKIIGLFTPTSDLSYEGMRIISVARNRYSLILSDYINRTYSRMTEEEKFLRLSKLIGIVKDVKQVSEMACRLFETMVSKNIADMQGVLSYDIHLRKY